MKWTIATANVRGMNNPEKQKDITTWHEDNKHTISIITETRIKPTYAQFLKRHHPNQIQLHSTDPENINGSGIAIIINKDISPHIHRIEEVPGRCITIQLKFKGRITITISAIYYQADRNKIVARKIIRHLESQHQNSTHSIIAGDFNEPNQKPKELIKWCKRNQLSNAARLFGQEHKQTWTNRTSQSTIDYIWTSNNLAQKIESFSIRSTTQYYSSDHKMIQVQININDLA
jgi:exonuclease III